MAGYKDDVGYTALEARGLTLPTGAGIDVIQVEAPDDDGNYMPDTENWQFGGKTITPRSGPPFEPSSHATTVGRYFYGNSMSLTGGISDIDAYEAVDYKNSSLKFGQSHSAPALLSPFDVMNHSWIGTWGGGDAEVLRRFDWQIANSNIVATVGVNNIRYDGGWIGQEMPSVFPSSYNAIAVGRTDGYNSNGPTLIDLPGRCKPDIVAPMTATSWATPVVGSAAALLLAQADAMGWSDAQDPRTVKSILMAGAAKIRRQRTRSDGVTIPPWQKGDDGTADDEEHPLDWYQGAGSLRIDQAWDILTAGPQETGGLSGWNLTAVGAGETDAYSIEVDGRCHFSAVLTWYRSIVGMLHGEFNTQAWMANIDLRLYREGEGTDIQLSASALDNVEHIWIPNLEPGAYVLEVIGDVGLAETYALAWHTMFLGDIDSDRDVDGTDLAVLGSNWDPAGTDKWWTEGDFDGDGDVDASDLATLGLNWAPAGYGLGHVPEPATMVLLGLGLVGLLLCRKRR